MGSVNQGMEMTKKFEGFRPTPYKDTRGIPTIGYGFNMAADPSLPAYLTQPQADTLFNKYYGQADQGARRFVGGEIYDKLTPTQMNILTDMVYNMGEEKLGKFKKMRAAILAGDNEAVVKEMKNSNWYNQTGNRAKWITENWR